MIWTWNEATGWGKVSWSFCFATSLVFMVGCGYPKVSMEAYKYSQAIYRATNQKDAAQIEKLRELVQAAVKAEELQPAEVHLLVEILDKAANEQWETANLAARELMMAQVQSE